MTIITTENAAAAMVQFGADEGTATTVSKLREAQRRAVVGGHSRAVLREAGHDPMYIEALDDDEAMLEALRFLNPEVARAWATHYLREAGVPGQTVAVGIEPERLTPQEAFAECGVPVPPAAQRHGRMREAETPHTLSDPTTDDDTTVCNTCDGDGTVGGRTCPRCSGSGLEPPDRQRASDPAVTGSRGNVHSPPPDKRDDPHTLSDSTLQESRRTFLAAVAGEDDRHYSNDHDGAVAALRESGINSPV